MDISGYLEINSKKPDKEKPREVSWYDLVFNNRGWIDEDTKNEKLKKFILDNTTETPVDRLDLLDLLEEEVENSCEKRWQRRRIIWEIERDFFRIILQFTDKENRTLEETPDWKIKKRI